MKIMIRDFENSLMVLRPQLAGFDPDLGGLFVDTGDYGFLVPVQRQEAEKHLHDLLIHDVLDMSHMKAVPVLDEDDGDDDGDDDGISQREPWGGSLPSLDDDPATEPF